MKPIDDEYLDPAPGQMTLRLANQIKRKRRKTLLANAAGVFLAFAMFFTILFVVSL